MEHFGENFCGKNFIFFVDFEQKQFGRGVTTAFYASPRNFWGKNWNIRSWCNQNWQISGEKMLFERFYASPRNFWGKNWNIRSWCNQNWQISGEKMLFERMIHLFVIYVTTENKFSGLFTLIKVIFHCFGCRRKFIDFACSFFTWNLPISLWANARWKYSPARLCGVWRTILLNKNIYQRNFGFLFS